VIETNQAEFESVLEDMINIRYDHHDIYKSVVPMQKFAKMIFAVFIKLAELDFIGAQKQRHGPVDLPGEKPKERKGPML